MKQQSTRRLIRSDDWDTIADKLQGIVDIPSTDFDEKKYINRKRSIEKLLDLKKLEYLSYSKKVLALNLLMEQLGLKFVEDDGMLNLNTTSEFNPKTFNIQVIRFIGKNKVVTEKVTIEE